MNPRLRRTYQLRRLVGTCLRVLKLDLRLTFDDTDRVYAVSRRREYGCALALAATLGTNRAMPNGNDTIFGGEKSDVAPGRVS